MGKKETCPAITIVICALNEEENLPYVLPKIPGSVNEVLLVDGHSNDATVEVAKKLCPKIRVLYQSGKGKGDAIKFGVSQATGDIIITLDADGQTNPDDIDRFIAPLLNGYDLAKGTRLAHSRPPNMTKHRWFGNKILAITSNILYGTKYTDICSGYNAFWKSAFQHLKLATNGYEKQIRAVRQTHSPSPKRGHWNKVAREQVSWLYPWT